MLAASRLGRVWRHLHLVFLLFLPLHEAVAGVGGFGYLRQ